MQILQDIHLLEDDKCPLNVCTANNKCPEVTGCGYVRLATTVDYSSPVLYERCTPEKKAQYTEKLD